jgi:predicted NAD/FAD-binding protein
VSRLSERELPATRRHGRFRDATRSRSTSASLGRAGHSHTVTTDYQGTPIAVNIGFIVHNELNYPDLTALFDHLGVETIESCMSFAVTADAGRFEWRGGGRGNWLETGKGLFAQRSNLASPSYLWMLCDILTFDNQSVADHAAGKLAGLTLGDYFRRNHFAPRLLTDYLAPMGAAIWSAPASEILLSGREFCRVLQQPSPAAI